MRSRKTSGDRCDQGACQGDLYAPTTQDKFAFGIWCVLNRGADPFGDPVRARLAPLKAIAGLAKRGAYGFEFHDNDLIPFGATARQRAKIVRDVKRVMRDTGIRATAGTTNLFTHPVFKDGAFTSSDPAIRSLAVQKVMRALDVTAELGAGVFLFWGGREGAEVDAAKDPVEAIKWFREAINYLCEYTRDRKYKITFSIEPKPNEPRGDIYLPTAGHALAFIATLRHPGMVGTNPEVAHVKMAGLNPYHEVAQALEAGKLADIHLNDQRMLRFDQDLSFGSVSLKEAFFLIKLLGDHGYAGTRSFDNHPYRTEADPWDFVDRNMRLCKILDEKVQRFNQDAEIQALLAEIHGANPDQKHVLARYSRRAMTALKAKAFDADRLAGRRLPYERLDHLLSELLLGVR